jgi:hypothetical protein
MPSVKSSPRSASNRNLWGKVSPRPPPLALHLYGAGCTTTSVGFRNGKVITLLT